MAFSRVFVVYLVMKVFVLFITIVCITVFAAVSMSAGAGSLNTPTHVHANTPAGRIIHVNGIAGAISGNRMEHRLRVILGDGVNLGASTMALFNSLLSEMPNSIYIDHEDADNGRFYFSMSYTFYEMPEGYRGINVVLIFENFESFLWFNSDRNENTAIQPDVNISRSLFFVERYVIMANPMSRGPMRHFIDHLYSTYLPGSNDRLVTTHTHPSSFRRTSTNATRTESHITSFDYIFRAYSPDQITEYIELFDRFANTPIWYVIGIAATAVFMAFVYIIFKNRQKANVTNNYTIQNSSQS